MKNYTSTLKVMFRSVLFWICLCVVAMEYLRTLSAEFHMVTRQFHENLAVPANLAVRHIPLMVTTLASVDLMRDRKNKFYDIISTTRGSKTTYYVSKICAYLTVGFGINLIATIGYYIRILLLTDGLSETGYGTGEWLCMLLVRWLVFTATAIIPYVGLAAAVTMLFRRSIAGIGVGVVVVFLQAIAPPLFRYFDASAGIYKDTFFFLSLYPIPWHVFTWLHANGTHAPLDEYAATTIEQFRVAVLCPIAAGVLLMVAGYALFRSRRAQK